ncbi:MAG: type II secretion system protein [Azonexus sp.]|nr:type II secretion system protein [Betaproteobacteria bacterium]MBK8916845.1 type II secretion system protein [Betaproteobacteria bacterium]MBP6037004.1 type II secretion system protein [Azonexus sp.]MBP6907593.1 type II secretion system protein [Azonexus sp.]
MCIEPRRPMAGVTLIEQIVFIVIVSVGVIGVLSTLGPALRFSADPQVRKQQLAVAEAVLAEILHQPFTYCDPDDANASTATLSGTSPTCASTDQDNGGGVLVPIPSGETRSATAPGAMFDNVADYAGYTQSNVTDLNGGNAVSGLDVSVAVSRIGAAYSAGGSPLPAGAALKIDVTVSGGGAEALTLSGYRFRYAPLY